jgi:hypothetical protein
MDDPKMKPRTVAPDEHCEVIGPDDDCEVSEVCDRPGGVRGTNLGRSDEPRARAALKAAGKEADTACTPAERDEAQTVDLASLSDLDLVMHYETTAPDDPQADRIANEMQARGLDYPGAP